MIEIKNTGGEVRGVLIGDPEAPETVKLLQPGEALVTNAAVVTVNDGASVKDRRTSEQSFGGRRVADPRTDLRQVNRQPANPSAAPAGNQSQDGERGTAATNPSTSDGTNVPKDASGEHLA